MPIALSAAWLPPLLLGEVESTQKQLAADFAVNPPTDERWRLCVAQSQTAGQGRGGATWLAQPGTALLMTVGAALPAKMPWLPRASLVAGLAVAQVLTARQVPVRIKWPNDLLILHDNRWLKLGGILCQLLPCPCSEPIWLCGVGLNLTAIPPALAGRAVSLADLAVSAQAHELAYEIAEAIRNAVLAWLRRGGRVDVATTEKYLCFLGEEVTLDLGAEGRSRTTLHGIDECGYLKIRNKYGRFEACNPLHIAQSHGNPSWLSLETTKEIQ